MTAPGTLTDVQRLEIELHAAETASLVRIARRQDAAAVEEKLVVCLPAVVRYCLAEGITPAMFTEADKAGVLREGYLAAVIATRPDGFAPGSQPDRISRRVRRAMGLSD